MNVLGTDPRRRGAPQHDGARRAAQRDAHALNRPSPRRSRRRSTPNASLNRSAVSTSPSSPAATTAAGAHQHGVGQRRRDVLDVVGDDDERGSGGVGGEVVEGLDELFASGQIEARRRLVEQHDGRLVHQRAGEQHAAALSRRQRGERVVGEAADAHAVEALPRPLVVGCGVAVPPRFEGAVASRAHGVERRQGGPQLVGEGGRHEPDAPPQHPDVGRPEPLAEHVDGARRGVLVERGDAQAATSCRSRWARAAASVAPVRTVEVDAVEDDRVAADEADLLSRSASSDRLVQVTASPVPRATAWPFVIRPRRVRHDRHPTETHRLHSRAVTWRRASIRDRGRSVLACSLPPVGLGRRHGDGAERRGRRRAGPPRRSRRRATVPTRRPRRGPQAGIELEDVDEEVGELEAEHDDLQAELDELRSATEQVAVNRYMAAGSRSDGHLRGPASVDRAARSPTSSSPRRRTARRRRWTTTPRPPPTSRSCARSSTTRRTRSSDKRDAYAEAQAAAEAEVVHLQEVEAQRLEDERVPPHPRGPAGRGAPPAASRSRGASRPGRGQAQAQAQTGHAARRPATVPSTPAPTDASAASRSCRPPRRRRAAGTTATPTGTTSPPDRTDGKPVDDMRRRRRPPPETAPPPTAPPRSGMVCPVRGLRLLRHVGRLALGRPQPPGRRHARRDRHADRRRGVRHGAVQADQPRRQLGVARRAATATATSTPTSARSPVPAGRCRRAR